eukprot:5097547-Pleurochrysis_carterae.AAC.2
MVRRDQNVRAGRASDSSIQGMMRARQVSKCILGPVNKRSEASRAQSTSKECVSVLRPRADAYIS